MNPVIRPAASGDMEVFYDTSPRGTIRAYVAELDGKPIGIAGLVYDGGKVVAFSAMKEEMRNYPVTMARSALFIAKMLPAGAVAKADPEEKGARSLLERLGFVPLDKSNGTYRWRG